MTTKTAFSDAAQTPADPFAAGELILITPEPGFGDMHAVLVSEKGRDKVHPLASEDELKTRRLGHENSSKRTFALSVPQPDGSVKLAAVIYTHWAAHGGNLPGDVDEILKTDSAPLSGPADTVTFYSISSFMRGAGERLILELHKKLTGEHTGLTLTTLSPLRSLRAWVEQNGDAGGDLKAAALQCLQANQDAVQKFHLSNGAYIGGINLEANHDASIDGVDGLGVMVNYVYPADPAKLAENAARYKQGEVIFAAGLVKTPAAAQRMTVRSP